MNQNKPIEKVNVGINGYLLMMKSASHWKGAKTEIKGEYDLLVHFKLEKKLRNELNTWRAGLGQELGKYTTSVFGMRLFPKNRLDKIMQTCQEYEKKYEDIKQKMPTEARPLFYFDYGFLKPILNEEGKVLIAKETMEHLRDDLKGVMKQLAIANSKVTVKKKMDSRRTKTLRRSLNNIRKLNAIFHDLEIDKTTSAIESLITALEHPIDADAKKRVLPKKVVKKVEQSKDDLVKLLNDTKLDFGKKAKPKKRDEDMFEALRGLEVDLKAIGGIGWTI